MKKIILFVSLCCMVSAMSHLHAQSIINKSWKTYIADPINDTAIFHIYADSSLITNSKGDPTCPFAHQTSSTSRCCSTEA